MSILRERGWDIVFPCLLQETSFLTTNWDTTILTMAGKVVGKGRLELPRLSAHDPKSCSSTGSDTCPCRGIRHGVPVEAWHQCMDTAVRLFIPHSHARSMIDWMAEVDNA